MHQTSSRLVKNTLRAVACLTAVYLQSDPGQASQSETLFGGFEDRLVCDVRWWLQMAPFNGQTEPTTLGGSDLGNDCRR